MQLLLTLKVDVKMKNALKKLADQQFISVSAVVKQAIEKHLQERGIDWRQQGAHVVTDREQSERAATARQVPTSAFYAVEISSRGGLIHQFNIREAAPGEVYTILIKEGSQLLGELKVGGVLRLKLYSSNPGRPVENREAEIIQISKNSEGRFKGHYTVVLKVLEEEVFG